MADYRIVTPETDATQSLVQRIADGAFIPEDPANLDWQAYLAWRVAEAAPDASASERTPGV